MPLCGGWGCSWGSGADASAGGLGSGIAGATASAGAASAGFAPAERLRRGAAVFTGASLRAARSAGVLFDRRRLRTATGGCAAAAARALRPGLIVGAKARSDVGIFDGGGDALDIQAGSAKHVQHFLVRHTLCL